jgi:hypothetical protein
LIVARLQTAIAEGIAWLTKVIETLIVPKLVLGVVVELIVAKLQTAIALVTVLLTKEIVMLIEIVIRLQTAIAIRSIVPIEIGQAIGISIEPTILIEIKLGIALTTAEILTSAMTVISVVASVVLRLIQVIAM